MPPRTALARLLGTTRPEDFAGSHWAQRLHLATAEQRGGDDFSDLFSLAAVDELISERGLRAPFLRVAKDGTTLPDRAFTAGGGVGAAIADQISDDRVLQLFADGATLVLQGLHRTWGPIREFSADLAADLGHPVQVNAYITPSQNQGFADHYDVHDVFVLQVHGEKQWTLHEPVLTAPLRDQPWTDRRAGVEARAGNPPYLQTTLRPGDCLYLPRGWIHAARALGGVTAHLTIGVQGWTMHHLAEALLDRAKVRFAHADAVRASLPLGVDLTDPDSLTSEVETARQAVLEAVRTLSASEIVAVLQGRQRAAQRPAPVAPLAQLAAVEAVQLQDRLRLRPHLMVDVLGGEGDEVTISSRAGRFGMATAQLPALRRLLAQGEGGDGLRVGDLAESEEEALAVARLLLRRGLALVVG